ncbi:hypothetical protein SLEP1_g34243 [Rubroshorea leprosula]|uniref:Uncharacterized protein n=1 Tax=Rubroshorea leprosula TaxID=152421 RepID=A0AAV5KJF7_9ROSI|nr:hypothetical protein SLEP1_g34243 [Rubroshorea leprosula]
MQFSNSGGNPIEFEGRSLNLIHGFRILITDLCPCF